MTFSFICSSKEKRISGSLQQVHSHSVMIEGVEIGDGKTVLITVHFITTSLSLPTPNWGFVVD